MLIHDGHAFFISSWDGYWILIDVTQSEYIFAPIENEIQVSNFYLLSNGV